MIPQIISYPFPVNSFGLCIALSLLACIVLVQKNFVLKGISSELAERYVMVAGISGLLGARALHLIEHWDEFIQSPTRMLFASAGFTFYGGFIVAGLTLVLMAWRDKLAISAVADSAGSAVAMGYAIGRLGCQLSGDGDYGIATTSWLGMSFSTGVVPTAPGVLVYPTPLYESSLALLIAFFVQARIAGGYWQVPGRLFGLSLFLLSIERFAVELIRINPDLGYGLSEAQIISAAMFVIGLILLRPFTSAAKHSDVRENAAHSKAS
jgi:phosphatidylglycerol---prolipoprotein diacylglyceryl transferase